MWRRTSSRCGGVWVCWRGRGSGPAYRRRGQAWPPQDDWTHAVEIGLFAGSAALCACTCMLKALPPSTATCHCCCPPPPSPAAQDKGRMFREAFLNKLSLLLRGTVAAPAERFGETLADEHMMGGEGAQGAAQEGCAHGCRP